MKKIGIVTLFHENYNYGGFLQAYALNSYLTNKGFNVETIRFEPGKKTGKNNKLLYIMELIKSNGFKSLICAIFRRLNPFKKAKKETSNKSRSLLFEESYNKIVSSKTIYSMDNINDMYNEYDFFIVGSDQVWNLEFTYSRRNFMLLSNKPKSKNAISYAASFGTASIRHKYKKLFTKSLRNFNSLSVREQSGVDIVKSLFTFMEAELVCDPTFLLDINEWEQFIGDKSSKFKIKKYILLYLLGEHENVINTIYKFANENGLCIIDISESKMMKATDNINLYHYDAECTSEDFVSYIKNATIVITDSFHACVFSTIHDVCFLPMARTKDSGVRSMNTRISSLLSLLNMDDSYLPFEFDEEILKKKVSQFNKIDKSRLELLITQSKMFLKKNLMII